MANRKIIVDVISFLFMALFVYAATSKLLDYQQFAAQLGQSAMLTRWAGIIAWLIPSIEILIAVLLILPATQRTALFAAVGLIVMFTAYITIVINFTPNVPCSCGGVLERLGWTEHIYFNSAFIVLGIVSLQLSDKDLPVVNEFYKIRTLPGIVGVFLLSSSFVIGLFLSSYDFGTQKNDFRRLFLPHFRSASDTIDVRNNGYYFSGSSAKDIYFGNVVNPLHVLKLNLTNNDTSYMAIELENIRSLTYWSLKLKIDSPYFYLADGTLPAIFRGSLNDWIARREIYDSAYFVEYAPIGPASFAIRSLSINGEHEVGKEQSEGVPHLLINPEILQKQVDGLFCVDGQLQYDKTLGRAVYTYYYRNQFNVMDSSMNLVFRGKTLDTVSHAQIRITTLTSNSTSTMSAPPLLVNGTSFAAHGHLFVNSRLMAENELEPEFRKTLVLDVFSLMDGRYKFSFYLDGFQKEKPRAFAIAGDKLVTFIDRYLLTYDLDLTLLKHATK